MALKAISLFTGAGGMDVGFTEAGFDVALANEIDSDASKTYSANHPHTTIITGDINKQFEEFARLQGEIDIVFGGPPCQGFSVAGKMDPNDARSQLIWSYLKVVEVVKPKVFVMENVKALAALKKWDDIKSRFLETAKDLGYNCTYIILNAADYGVPQKRERVFFIGSRIGTLDADALQRYFAKIKSKRITVREAWFPFATGEKENPLTCSAKITLAERPVMRKSPYAGMIFNGMGRPIDIDGQANTLPASMGGNKTPIIDADYLQDQNAGNWITEYHQGLLDGRTKPSYGATPQRLRRITINEAARIQTFPIDYKFVGNKSSVYKQIGNAVPCLLASKVARYVHDNLFE
jgi:DNA (cytosine-5)-methyltransferase 1